jgi:hypothetical protein
MRGAGSKVGRGHCLLRPLIASPYVGASANLTWKDFNESAMSRQIVQESLCARRPSRSSPVTWCKGTSRLICLQAMRGDRPTSSPSDGRSIAVIVSGRK